MDQETLSHLFEPFFTTKEQGKGTGLGLCTVFGIVRQHRGTIQPYSKPGQGTTFEIYLPRLEGTTEEDSSEASSNASLQGEATVLLAEDERVVQAAAYIAARLAGADPIAAARAGHRLAGVVVCHPGAIIPRAAMPPGRIEPTTARRASP